MFAAHLAQFHKLFSPVLLTFDVLVFGGLIISFSIVQLQHKVGILSTLQFKQIIAVWGCFIN
jgi:hypothetical protein